LLRLLIAAEIFARFIRKIRALPAPICISKYPIHHRNGYTYISVVDLIEPMVALTEASRRSRSQPNG
jgi:hypothetical protein